MQGVLRPHPASRHWIGRVRKRCQALVCLSEDAFSQAAATLQSKIEATANILAIDNVVESFALTNESLRRSTGMSYYDVQLLGGFALAAGTIAEIQTGEGKTITTALPAVLHAWMGRGVHVATTNDYLSKRDHDELLPVFERLGLSVGHLESQGPLADKTRAYACDITYGPGYEFGFDFLKDQISIRSRPNPPLGTRYLQRLRGVSFPETRLAQRGHAFAIIDEADSVLIDEATTPLILSGGQSSTSTATALYEFAKIQAASLTERDDYLLDLAKRSVRLTEAGWQRVYKAFSNRPAGRLARPWSQLIENALRAQHLFRRDVDYVVDQDKVLIVDQNTGRIHDERTWSSGLHQAVEVKEQVPVTPENETQARITRQRYTGFYAGIAGLTGTATGSETELREFYDLPVIQIPTHKPCVRKTMPLRSFDNCENKLCAIAKDSIVRSRTGQPVLIGTRTIRESIRLSEILQSDRVEHTILNGLQSEEEAAIVGQAGTAGTITVATNMAGRGTDIKLDARSLTAGGLHVAATEMHHSGRVDRQLSGRAARQGNPGSCQFFASAEDEMICANAPRLAAKMIANADRSGECNVDFSPAMRRLQSTVESESLRARREMVQQDAWMESIQSSLARRA